MYTSFPCEASYRGLGPNHTITYNPIIAHSFDISLPADLDIDAVRLIKSSCKIRSTRDLIAIVILGDI